jgi:phage baseplate assembly protein gpV
MHHRLAIIVETHPQDHSVDLVMLDDGARYLGVQVLAHNASTRSGMVDMPKLDRGKDKWNITKITGQEMKALVGFVGGQPVVIGALFPQVNQMLLKDPQARRYRHQSDVETLIDGDGNMQVRHPSGTYIRIGESVDADTLDGKFADKSATDRNTDRRVNIHIGLADGVLELTMTPSGAVTLRCNQGVTVEAGQDSTIKAPNLTLDANVTVTKNFTVQGSTSLQAVTSRNKDISSTHTHIGVTPGPAPTGVVS